MPKQTFGDSYQRGLLYILALVLRAVRLCVETRCVTLEDKITVSRY